MDITSVNASAAPATAIHSGNGTLSPPAETSTGKTDKNADASQTSRSQDAGSQAVSGAAASSASVKLSEQARTLLSQLKASDAHVRAHELAHLAAAGGLANGGPSFTYERGPDGQSYAVGGEVSIDTSPGNTPEETIARARTIQAAALAPADPSGQDIAVAASARQMEQQAQAELQLQRAAEIQQAYQQATSGSEARTSGKGSRIDHYA
ncbi:MAG: catalase [Burkholderiales bacterium]|nr:catalase [Burkholderiales bacterium]